MLYGLRRSANSTVLRCMHGYSSDEYVHNHYDLHLADVFLRDDHGDIWCRYRLHANKPHTIEMALAYNVQCPKCGTFMKQIGRTLSPFDLGLYACPACDREKTSLKDLRGNGR